MSWKCLPVVLLAGAILTLATAESEAEGPHGPGDCAPPVTADCGAPCAPAPVMTQKVLVTQYVSQPYETTRTVYQTKTKEEKFTAYRCEVVPVQKKRMVTTYKMVPKTVEQTVVRCEVVPVVSEVPVTRYETVPVVSEVTVMRCEVVPVVSEVPVTRYETVPSQEERTVTRYETKTVPVTTTVSRCVDRGGHYECREVACATGGGGCFSGFRGLCGRRRGCASECGSPCAPATTLISVYVPNYVTEQVPVTTYRTVCQPVTEKVMVTVYKSVPKQETVKVTRYQQVQKPETVKVTTYKCVPKQETVKVTRYQQVQKPETVKVTVNECVPVTGEETFTVYEMKQTPYEATRTVAYAVPVEEKVTAYRMVPVTVEKEVPVAACAPYESCYSGGGRRGLFCRH